jgi:tetratricopeptide (TPR) repeat protein
MSESGGKRDKWYWQTKGSSELNEELYSSALDSFEKALEIEPDFPEALYSKAMCLFHLKRYEEALKLSDKVLAKNPLEVDVMNIKGASLYRLMRYDESLKCYDKALGIDSKNSFILNNKAWLLVFKGLYSEALKAIEEAVENNPGNGSLWDTMGYVKENTGNFSEAIQHYNKAIEIDEKHLNSWIKKGVSHLMLRQYDHAIESFEKAINISNDCGDAWLGIGQALHYTYDYEFSKECLKIAIDIYNSIINTNKNNIDYIDALNGIGIALGELEENKKALDYFEEIIRYYKKNNISPDYNLSYALRNKGVCLIKNGQFQEALECFKQISKSKNVVYAYVISAKGAALASIGMDKHDPKSPEFDEAVKCFDEALKLLPSLATPLFNKGLLFEFQKKYEEAKTCFEQVLLKDTEYTCARIGKGRILNYQSKYDSAMEAFDYVIDHYIKLQLSNYPCLEDAYRLKAYSLLINGDKTLTTSSIIDLFDKAKKIGHLSVHTWNSWGHALSYIGEYQKAVECFDEALKLDQNSVSALANKGFCLGCLGKTAEADECFERATSLDKANAMVYNFKGLYFFHLRRFMKAVECFDEAIRYGDSGYPLVNKGYAFISSGWTYDAIESLDKVGEIKDINKIRSLTEVSDPVFTYAMIGKGIGLDELQQHDHAIEYFLEALRLNRNDAGDAYFSIARSKYIQGDYSEALEYFKKVEDERLNAEKHNGIGLCYFNLGLIDDAEYEFREAIKSNPKLVEVYYNLGVLYNHEEQKDRAKALFNTCIRIDKSYSKAKLALREIEGTQQLSDWYHWWFKSGISKRMLGSGILGGIVILFIITTLSSLIPQIQPTNSDNFPFIAFSSLIGIFQPSNSTTENADESNPPSTIGPNIAALITLLILLILILLLPTLRSIKMGTLELTTAPINTNPTELKPSTPRPFTSLHMQLRFHMPLKPEITTR